MTEDEPEIIYSERSGSYLVEGQRLEVLIYKTDRDPSWVLEVVNSNGTSVVWDASYIGDEMAWREFQDTVEKEGVGIFLDKDKSRMTLH